MEWANGMGAHRELNEGHTVGHHTFSHLLLNHMPVAAAEAETSGVCRRRHRRLRQHQRGAEDAVLPLPWFCREPALAGTARASGNRGVRLRSLGERLESDVCRPGAPAVLAPGSRAGESCCSTTKAETRRHAAGAAARKNRDYRVVHVVAAPRQASTVSGR